jgi:hypothetical protein
MNLERHVQDRQLELACSAVSVTIYSFYFVRDAQMCSGDVTSVANGPKASGLRWLLRKDVGTVGKAGWWSHR